MDIYQQYIAKSRYSRYLDDQGRREHWPETVDRYCDYMVKHLYTRHGYKFEGSFLEEIRSAILNLEVMPSMRLMMTAGPAVERSEIAGFNCAYCVIDDVKSFDEIMYILLNGTGVGFSVERRYTDHLPEVPDLMFNSETTIVVKDSKEGWAKALRQLIALLYTGEIPKWDLSRVRPAGSRLKTFGGRASGPEPLDELFNFIVRVFKKAKGRKLHSVECMDIVCKTAEVVVVGGVRRSALICLTDLDDDKARRSKSGQWWVDNPQRRLANISAVYESCPDSEEFIREWLSLMESRSGERGIFSRSASRERCKATGRRDPNHEWGTNPCCVTGDTILHTTEGPKRIRDLEKTPFKAVVNGVAWDAPHGSWISGHAEVFQVSTSRGFSFKATAEHQVMTSNRSWVMVKDLTVDDKIVVSRTKEPLVWEGKGTFEEGLLLGAFIGDGNFIDSSKNHCGEIKVWKHDLSDRMKESLLACSSAAGGRSDRKGWVDRGSYYRMSISNLPKKYNIPRKPKQCSVELELTSSEFQKGFVTAYFDADGHVEGTQDSGYRVVVGSVHLQNLQILQRMLARQGILSRIYVTESGRPRSFCGIYDSKPLHRLFVSSESLGAFQKAFGFTHERKAALLNHAVSSTDFYSQKWETAFTSRVSCGIEEVWDAHVDGIHAFDANGLVLHNSEIVLRPNQMCNLSEVVCRPEDTPEDLLRKVRIATFLGTYQSTLTNFPYLRKQWIKNMEEERLLGVSLTGILDCATLVYRDETGTIQVSKDLLQTLRSSAVEANKQFAEELGIGQSMAVTCVKPSGTVSQLADCSSGLHGGHAPYYYRRVRSDSKDPITKFLLDAGFPGEPEVHNAGTTVFTFPKKAGPHTILRTELSALDHLRIWMDFQEHWCEHKPSVTISVKPKEWPLVAAYVYENFDHMTGVSFLPFFEENTTYKQLPYETVTEQRYLELLEQIPKEIDWEKFIEFDDNVEGVQNLACSGGFCEI